jgi:archaetidylinositol phosphate synthase
VAFERLRGRWERLTAPLLDLFGWLRPNHLTWASLFAALAAASVALRADRSSPLAWLTVGALMGLAFLLDGLDGQLARKRGVASAAGDLLDHTLDRVVDVALLVALGSNASWFLHPELGAVLGWAAALATLLGSYMGTAAQSVGLKRDYGGFSRADRSIVLMLGVLGAATQSANQWPGFTGPSLFGGSLQWNSVSIALTLCLAGGLTTFALRFRRSLRELSEQSDFGASER